MSSLINLCGFVDDCVFLTKSGDLGAVLGVGGIDDECLDADEREAVTRRFEAALRLCDEHIRLYQYVLKRNRVTIEPSSHPDPAVDALLARRDRFLQARQAALFAVDLYFVVVAERPRARDAWAPRVGRLLRHPAAQARRWLSTTRTIAAIDEDLERRRIELRQRVDGLVLQLADTVGPRVLTTHEAYRFLRRLLNYAPAKAEADLAGGGVRRSRFLDYDVCDSQLECHRSHLRLDDDLVRVLTLKEPPARTFPHMLQRLYEVPSNLIIVTEWQRERAGRVRREIHAKRRHFHNAKVSLASYLIDQTPSSPADLLIDDSAAALVQDLGAALTELTLQNRYFGQFTLTVIVYDTDPAALERSIAACAKALALHDGQLTDERYNLLNAWIAALPGHTAYNLRSMHLLNTNYADLSLLCSEDGGAARNPHLGREALAVLETTHATAYALNLHVGDVGHTLVLGATGSGKSFALNFLIAQLQRYSPRTLIFDLGGSYRSLTEYFGGRILRVALDRRTFRINPFCLSPTTANRQFLFSFVKVLIQSGGQYLMTRADDQDLYEQIETLGQLDRDHQRLFTLANILSRPLGEQLQRWVQGGQYADLFDHVDDTVTFAPFQYVDFDGLEAAPQILEPLLFYLLHRSTATVNDPALSQTLKVFVLDEAWRFFHDSTIRAYVTEALKTWRRKNACVLLATQSSEDLERSELLRVAIESCPTKIFLANPDIDRAAYRTLFHLNETETERIATLIARRQLLLKRPGVAKVLNLEVDTEAERLFGASPGRCP
jgi:type IV secretion system protein VirB4